eukprot:2174522-Rhodomonas_salina.5
MPMRRAEWSVGVNRVFGKLIFLTTQAVCLLTAYFGLGFVSEGFNIAGHPLKCVAYRPTSRACFVPCVFCHASVKCRSTSWFCSRASARTTRLLARCPLQFPPGESEKTSREVQVPQHAKRTFIDSSSNPRRDLHGDLHVLTACATGCRRLDATVHVLAPVAGGFGYFLTIMFYALVWGDHSFQEGAVLYWETRPAPPPPCPLPLVSSLPCPSHLFLPLFLLFLSLPARSPPAASAPPPPPRPLLLGLARLSSPCFLFVPPDSISPTLRLTGSIVGGCCGAGEFRLVGGSTGYTPLGQSSELETRGRARRS